jgi:hypothetical protein
LYAASAVGNAVLAIAALYGSFTYKGDAPGLSARKKLSVNIAAGWFLIFMGAFLWLVSDVVLLAYGQHCGSLGDDYPEAPDCDDCMLLVCVCVCACVCACVCVCVCVLRCSCGVCACRGGMLCAVVAHVCASGASVHVCWLLVCHAYGCACRVRARVRSLLVSDLPLAPHRCGLVSMRTIASHTQVRSPVQGTTCCCTCPRWLEAT